MSRGTMTDVPTVFRHGEHQKMFELSIRTLENKNLIRINETLLEDGLIKIVNYEIHF